MACLPVRSLLALFGCFMARLITNGSVFCLGVYYEEIRISTGENHFKISLLFSIAAGTLPTTGLFVSVLLKRFSERSVVMAGGLIAGTGIFLAYFASNIVLLILTLGLLNGIGQGLAFVSTPVAGSFIFPQRYHHIAISLQNCGDGVGFFLFPILYEALIRGYGWRSSLMILSGIALNLSVCGALMGSPEIAENKRKIMAQFDEVRRPRKGSKKSLWASKTFFLLLINAFCHQLGFVVFFTFIFAHLKTLDVDEHQAALVTTLFGLSSIISRLSISLLNNHRFLRRWTVYALGCVAEGGAMTAMAYLSLGSPNWLYSILAVIMGLGSGFVGGLSCCVALDALGPEHLTDSFSFMNAAWGIGSLIGAPIGGFLRDRSDSYLLALAFGGCLDFLGGLILLPFFCLTKYYEIQTENEELRIEEHPLGMDSIVGSVENLKLAQLDPIKGSLMEVYGGPELAPIEEQYDDNEL